VNSETEILDLISAGLEAASKNQATSELGDRRSYLGISDLARGLSCTRAVVLDKLQEDKCPRSLQSLLQLSRGHWLEHGIERALENIGVDYMRQLEISVKHGNSLVKAHLDLVLPASDCRSVTVLEIKSAANKRDYIYGTHEAQIYGQISLLLKLWNEPVFKITSDSSYLNFPELVKSHLKIITPDIPPVSAVRGFVLTVSTGDARAFGPYQPNTIMLDMLLDKAKDIGNLIDDLQSGRIGTHEIPFQSKYSALCDYCPHNHDCPKYSGILSEHCDHILHKLSDLKITRSSLDDEIKECEDQLKSYVSQFGRYGEWITASAYRFKVMRQNGRATLEQQMLRDNLKSIANMEENFILQILASSTKEGKPFDRLLISPVK
jgi:hypothetical protein